MIIDPTSIAISDGDTESEMAVDDVIDGADADSQKLLKQGPDKQPSPSRKLQ